LPKKYQIINMKFLEVPFLYADEEYQRWVTKDTDLIDSMLEICKASGKNGATYLGQEKSTYFNQCKQGKGSQHFPEVKFAVHLVKDKGFNPDYIFYEKFRLSQKFFKSLIGKTNPDAFRFLRAYDRLRKIFSDDFFIEFDRLCELNKEQIERKTKEQIAVDLCAVHNRKRQVCFFEMKKYNFGKTKTELLKQEQLLFLGFVRYIIDNFKEKAFQNKVYKIMTELVVFVPDSNIILFDDLKKGFKQHPVEFRV
jgi:hypothetical protein